MRYNIYINFNNCYFQIGSQEVEIPENKQTMVMNPTVKVELQGGLIIFGNTITFVNLKVGSEVLRFDGGEIRRCQMVSYRL